MVDEGARGSEVRGKRRERSHAALSHTHPQNIGVQIPMSLWGMLRRDEMEEEVRDDNGTLT